MEADDLVALLDRELDLLDCDDDGNDDFDMDLTLFSRAAAEVEVSRVIDEDMNLLAESAKSLLVLNAKQTTTAAEVIHVEAGDQREAAIDLEISNQVRDIIAFEPYSFKDPKELTEEQKLIIADLMQLMIESVERCAPILERTELEALQATVSAPLTITDIPKIILDDSQVILGPQYSVVEVPVALKECNEIGLIDEKLDRESKLRKEELISAAQQSDQLVWDESRRYKEALEQERVRQEERKLKREQARVAALQEKATINLQRLYRGFTARQAYRKVTARLSALARLEEERLRQQQLQEEAIRRQRLQQERDSEQRERVQMALMEQQCRTMWLEMARQMEARRQDELAHMHQEDQLSGSIRGAILQAKVKMQSYIALAAQEDVEYDISECGSDSDCDSLGDTEDEIIDGHEGAYINTPSNREPAQQATPGGASVTSATAAIKPVPPAGPAATTRTVLRAAPSKAKPVVSVDPTQGKKWGGSVSTAWNAVDTVVVASPAQDNSPSGELLVSESTRENAAPYTPPPRTVAEQQTLETHWKQLARQGIQKCALAVEFESSSVAKAKSIFDRMCKSAGKSQSVPRQSSPQIIQALHHWQACWSEQQEARKCSSNGALQKIKLTKPRAVTPAPARDVDNEKALQNSMVDLNTDPLLAKELDFCVEGLSSTDFLAQFTNLSKLAINVNKISELSGLQGLSMLLHLSAKDNRISSVDALSDLKQLRYLYLDSNKLSDLSPLDGLDQLVVLSANSNSLGEFPCLNCASLQRLELGRNRIPSIPSHALLGMPNLNHLNLSSNQLVEASGEALSSCVLLQTLILSENQLSAVPAPLRLPLLKNLRINLNRITNLDAWKHDGSAVIWPFFAPSLQKLVLSDNQISSLVDVICMLPLLQELDLSFNALTTQEAVVGIRQCKLLTALHVQDNVFTTVPVNTGGAAGTSRTALPAPQQTALNHWLCALCPNLESISGNRLVKAEFSEAHVQRRPGQITTHFNQNRTWLAPDFKVQDSYYQHEPLEVRALIQLLQAHHHSQNILTVKERAVKKDEIAASKSNGKRVNSSSAEQAKTSQSASKNWELELATLLVGQRDQLLRCGQSNKTSSGDNVVFVSYAKESPNATDYAAVAPTVPAVVLEVRNPPRVLNYDQASMPIQTTPTTLTSSAGPAYDSEEAKLIALQLQKHHRGRRVRKRLGNALQSIRYQDNELDDMFGGEEFNFEQEMRDLAHLEEETPSVMVYGDHIRKRSRHNSSVKANQSAPPSMSLPLQLPGTNHWVLPADDSASPPKQAHSHGAPLRPSYNDSRPGTGMTSVSSISAHTDAPDSAASAMVSGANSPAASRSALSSRSEEQDQISTMSSARRSNKAVVQAKAEEWGISDPKVLATFAKREQRIRHFNEAKERAERDKDPQYRLEQFQRNAHKPAASTSGNTRTSGSFGGAPKTLRSTGGAAKRKTHAVPAWMLGEGGGAGEEEA